MNPSVRLNNISGGGCYIYLMIQQPQTKTVVLVRKRTIPIERPPLVGEVSANFS
jgi:hypothetical protein